jgi:DNA-binding NarL/FixJ family response regulator
MYRTQILLVEVDVLLRETLVRLMDSEVDLAVAGQCATTAEALDLLARVPAELVLLDADGGFDAAHEFVHASRASGYAGKLLLMTTDLSPQASVRALQSGVLGIIRKSRGVERLLRAIRLVASGEAWVDPDMVQVLAQGGSALLTNREQEVLRGVLDGLTNKTIAARLGVPEATVKAALRRIFRRNGVHSRTQLIRAALDGTLGARQR